MPRGGWREGAGRKPGSANLRTRAIADQAAAEGRTPLEIMLKAMRWHEEAGRWDQAAAVARDAAPYCHPRLSSTETTMQSDNVHRVISEQPLTEEEWLQKFAPEEARSSR
jgi:hypothetical protein